MIFRWVKEQADQQLDGLCGFYLSLVAGALCIFISTFSAFLGLLNGLPGPSFSTLFVLSLYTNLYIPWKVGELSLSYYRVGQHIKEYFF